MWLPLPEVYGWNRSQRAFVFENGGIGDDYDDDDDDNDDDGRVWRPG